MVFISFTSLRDGLAALALIVSCAAFAGCSKKSDPLTKVYRMGDKAQAGPLIYNVLEAEWKPQIGEGPAARVPKNRFLVLRVTITNSGSREIIPPFATLEDSKGNTFVEESNGEGLMQWLGVLRHVAPAQTDDGQMLFDVPTAGYKLYLRDDGEPGQEGVAVVDLPLEMNPDLVRPGEVPPSKQ